MRYLRTSFFYGRTFLNDADLHEQAMRWTADIANQRVHGTTQDVPAVRFARAEQHTLLPLAARPYRSLVLPPETPHVANRDHPRPRHCRRAAPALDLQRPPLAEAR